MTRLENRLSRRELFDIGEAFIDDFIASYESEPDSIIIDADDTNADTYGAQQLTLFNAYYGEYCYMPLLLSAVSIDEKKTCIRLRFSQKAPMLPEMVSVLTRLRHLPPS